MYLLKNWDWLLAKRSRLRSNQRRNKYISKKKKFVHSIKMLNLSLNELKLFSKSRGIKGHKSTSEERLVSSLNESKSVKESGKNFDDARREKIRNYFNELRDFFKSKKDIRKDLYIIKSKKLFPCMK